MRFALPLGLLGFIAIAFLILIYILKPKYQDKKFSSTYIWKLSLKYVKRKVPLQWLQSSLLFIIQLLILSVIAFSMAAPHIVLASRSGEKIVVLDASASMTAEDAGRTRFDRAKSQISSLIDQTTETHKISIILAGEDASFIIRRSDSASYAKQKLFEAECSLAQSDIPAAMTLAESVLTENPSAEVYLFTDCDYGDYGKVNVVNMSNSEWNAAVLNFSAVREKGRYVFTAEVASYGRAAEIAVGLSVDGKTQLPKLAVCGEGEAVKVIWDDLDVGTYESASIHLSADDSFAYDNDFYIYSPNNELFKVELVSKDPGFLNSALRSTEKCQTQIIVPDEEGIEAPPVKTSGYDLYVFDNYIPDVMPKDGTVWLINPPQQLPSSLGLTVSGTRNASFKLASSGSSSQTAMSILQAITPSSVNVTEYTRITAHVGYESIMQINGDPVLLVKDDNGLKTVVLAFDIHMSDLPVVPEYPLFINALCDYSMAYTIEKTLYEVGDEVKLNAKADADTMSVTADYGNGEEDELVYTTFPVELATEKSGVYTVMQQTDSGRTVSSSFFVRISEGESAFGRTEDVLVNPITPYGNGTDTSVANNTMDIYVYLIGALLLLLCVEWGLQYREQY